MPRRKRSMLSHKQLLVFQPTPGFGCVTLPHQIQLRVLLLATTLDLVPLLPTHGAFRSSMEMRMCLMTPLCGGAPAAQMMFQAAVQAVFSAFHPSFREPAAFSSSPGYEAAVCA